MTIQKLKLQDDLFEGLYTGFRTATVRYGRRDVVLGTLVFESVNDSVPPFEVTVTGILHTTLIELSDEICYQAGSVNAFAMMDDLKTYYPTISLDSEVTAILFVTMKDDTNAHFT